MRVYDPATGLWAVRIVLDGSREVTVVLDAAECERFGEIAGRYGTPHLPANEMVVRAMLHAATGRDVLTDLLTENP